MGYWVGLGQSDGVLKGGGRAMGCWGVGEEQWALCGVGQGGAEPWGAGLRRWGERRGAMGHWVGPGWSDGVLGAPGL